MLTLILIAGTAACSYACVGWVRIMAQRKRILDIPNARSSHTSPTPRGGGLAIFIVTCGGLLLSQVLYATWPAWSLAGFLIGATIIAAVSWIDDLRSLPCSMRFLAHCCAAIVVVETIGVWNVVEVPLVGQVTLGWLGYPLTFLWVVGVINAYNFMDGIDGLAGGQAVVAALGWCLLGWLSGQPAIFFLALLVGASSLGFLGHNWPPARIFMGDIGSTFLGFTMAVLAIVYSQTDPYGFFIGILLLWPFLFDATSTFLRRLRKGENVFASHRSHLYQRLIIANHSHLTVTTAYILLAVGGLLAALAWRLQLPGGPVYAALFIPALALGLFMYTKSAEYHTLLRHDTPDLSSGSLGLLARSHPSGPGKDR